jgi:hypothetical protein
MRTGLVLTVILGAGACAPGQRRSEPAPRDLLVQALGALEAGDVRLAFERANAIPADSSAASRQVLLLQALLALDPRNPDRSPEQGAALSARYVASANDRADAAVGIFLYALALDLGAAPDRAAGLPQLAVRPLATRIQELERAVARLRTELARIQETLKP